MEILKQLEMTDVRTLFHHCCWVEVLNHTTTTTTTTAAAAAAMTTTATTITTSWVWHMQHLVKNVSCFRLP